MESTEILQEFTMKSQLNILHRKKQTFLRSKYGKFVEFSFFYVYGTIILKILMSLSATKFHYNEYHFVIPTTSLYRDFTVIIS
jgi:hypothetical protein